MQISEVWNPAIPTENVKAMLHVNSGNGGINIKLVKTGGLKVLAVRSRRYLVENTIPRSWKELKTVLLHKNSNKEDLENYRSICLHSHMAIYENHYKSPHKAS